MTFEGFSAPDGPVVEIEGWEAAAGTTKTVYIPPAGTTGPSTITVRIPPGVADNTLLRLPGAAPPPGPGMPPGDLIVRVRVKNASPPPVMPASAPPGSPSPFPPAGPYGAPGVPSGPPAYGAPGPPAYGAPGVASGPPAYGAPGVASGPPAYGSPGVASGPPAYGAPGATTPMPAYGAPSYGAPGGPYAVPGAPMPLGGPVPPGAPPAGKSGGGKRALIAVGVVVAVLAACGVGAYALASSGGSKPRAGASAGSSPQASSSPSPTPVSAEVYQQALAALDAAVAPGFQQLRAARNPTTVSSAITSISNGLSTQIETLRAMAPPAAVSDAHSTFVDALTVLASDVQSAASAAGSRELCGGSSAISTISRSPGANQVRTAAKGLSTADAANAYKVGSWLPATTAQQNRRAANGTYIKSPARRGSGRLKVQNGGSVDAVVTLAPSGGKATLTVYVRAKGSFTASRITDGTYGIYVATGADWDSGAKAFTRNCDFSKFDTPATYRTTSSTYTQYSITLTPVSGGNATTSGVDPGQFPS